MGCQSSKLDIAEDSIHVILSHAAKNGEIPKLGSGYVPRKPHPLENREQPNTAVESDGESQNEIDRLLYHAAHHNDTVDPRDLEEYCVVEEGDDETQ